jgi:hypothetical protein
MTHAPLDLIASLGQGNAGAFVGAGLSIGAGLPGWYDLIAELSARIGYDLPPAKWATGDALIDAAQAYVNRQGLNALIRHLKDRLDTTGVPPSAAHRALARLPISLVFTANFDDLLERAFRDAGKRVEVVVRDSSIPFMRRGPNVVNIVKLYGDLDQPDTIVLARQQYESYFLQRPQMVKLLETELARSDMLYLGWSGSDPYFKLVFGELLSRFGPMMRPGYAVMFDVTDAQRDELARRQIRPVELPAGDRTASLAAWLAGLVVSNSPPIVPPASTTTVGADLQSWVTDKSCFPLRFIIRGNWQTVRALVTPPVVSFTSAEVEKLELSYTGIDATIVTAGGHDDWRQGILATMKLRGQQVERRVGQIVTEAFGENEMEVILTLDARYGEVLIPVFQQVLHDANTQGLIVENLNAPRDNLARTHTPSNQPSNTDRVAAPSSVSSLPALGEPAHVTASGAGSVAIGGNVHDSVIIIGNGNVVGDGSSSRVEKGLPATKPPRSPQTWEVSPAWNTAALRDLLNAAFNDEELTTLCFDHFRPVYDDFAGGMSKGQKVQRLLDYCTRREQVDELLAAVRKANPAQVRRFEDRLRG